MIEFVRKGVRMQNHLYNLTYEKAILSSILYDPTKVEECREIGLKAHDFYLPFHQKLYTVIELLYEDSIVDEEIIKDKMAKDFDENAMIQVMSTNPVVNLTFYVDKLQELSKLRTAEKISLKIRETIYDTSNFNETIKIFSEGLNSLENNKTSLVNIKPIGTIESKEAEFIGKEWLPFPKKAVSLVTAGGGVGKSFLMLQAAMRMIDESNVNVFMWLSEDPVELSKYRFEMIAKNVLHTDVKNYEGKLDIAGSDSETIHFLEEEKNKLQVSGVFYQFKAMLKKYNVIILDPLIAMFGGDENNNAHAKQFINLFSRWATVENKTIIFIHHGTKNTAQSRGASAFVDAVRLVYQVEIIKNNDGEQIEDHLRLITLAKDNNGAKKYLGDLQVKRQIFPKVEKKSLSIEIAAL